MPLIYQYQDALVLAFYWLQNIFPFFHSQHLLRQGREAVIVAHELDVVSTELSEEAPTHAGDMVRETIC